MNNFNIQPNRNEKNIGENSYIYFKKKEKVKKLIKDKF